MKLKKNHFHMAALIGHNWGYFSEKNQITRLKKVCKINLLDYFNALRKNKNTKLSSFINVVNAENVLYSRVYLESTEEKLQINKKELTFLKLVKGYQDNNSIFKNPGNRKAIIHYLALITQRNPVHYEHSVENIPTHFLNDIFFTSKIVSSHNQILLNSFQASCDFLENFHFDIISTKNTSNIGIILGTLTHLSKDSRFYQTKVIQIINKHLGKHKHLINTKFMLTPIDNRSFLLAVEKDKKNPHNFSTISAIFKIFRNNILKIIRIWNELQTSISREIVFHYDDIHLIDDSIFFPRKDVNYFINSIKQSLDFNLNTILDTQSIQKTNVLSDVFASYQKWKKIILILNNKKSIPIHLNFIDNVRKKELNEFYIDSFQIKIFLQNTHNKKIILKHFNISKDGRIFFNNSIYCENFYSFFNTLMNERLIANLQTNTHFSIHQYYSTFHLFSIEMLAILIYCESQQLRYKKIVRNALRPTQTKF